MDRRKVLRTDRIKVTERLIAQCGVGNVLEIGAGDYSFDYLADPFKGSWIKVDFAQPCDVVCDLNSQKVKLPFDDGTFELVVCTQVLEHLLWPHSLLSELQRVLVPGGKLLVSVPNCVSITYRLAWLLGRIPSCAASGNLPPEHGSTAYRQHDGATVGGHVIDFNVSRFERLLSSCRFRVLVGKGSGVIWHRQILPAWSVPLGLSSNIIFLAEADEA